jgi:ferrous iron transport protein B
MELPPYHLPAIGNVLIRTWDRLKAFVLRAGRVIVGVVIVIAFLNSWGSDGSFGNQDSDKSVLASIGKTMVPVCAPMGIDEDNWPATVGIFTGLLAKEAVVGTLDALYGGLAASEAGDTAGEEADGAAFSLWDGIAQAFATIPVNLAAVVDLVGDPLGLDIGEVGSLDAAATDQEVATGTFTAMAARFDGAAGAFAYLLLVLLYMPCVAAIAAVYRETNLRWTLFVCAWTTLMGYSAAVLFYQTATFARDPATSLLWILGMLALIGSALAAMWLVGRRDGVPRAVIVPGT